MAAENFDDIPVESDRFRTTFNGFRITGAYWRKGCRKRGRPEDCVCHAILEKKPLTNAFAKLDTLEYLRRGGRLVHSATQYCQLIGY